MNKYEPRALGWGGQVTVEQDGLKPTRPGGGDVIAVCLPRATREDAGRTGPGALCPNFRGKKKVAAIGNFKCPNWQRGGL